MAKKGFAFLILILVIGLVTMAQVSGNLSNRSYEKVRTNEAPIDLALYENTWNTNRVKMPNFNYDKLPDETVIKLVDKKNDRYFHFPCNGRLSSTYGWRWNRPHGGIDFAIKIGEPIYAAFDGVVRVAKTNGGYGKMVLIRHFNNLETLYGHLSKILVDVGQEVKAGDTIGYSGNTGFSTGPHLHFETRFLYRTIDPEWILDIENKCLRTEIIKIDRSFFRIEKVSIVYNEPLTKLSKVDKALPGKPYIPIKSGNVKMINNMLARGGNKPLGVSNENQVDNNDKSTWRYTRVAKGDDIAKLSKKFNVSIKQIIEMNSLSSEVLKENQLIRIR